jgi:hypothetical protein
MPAEGTGNPGPKNQGKHGSMQLEGLIANFSNLANNISRYSAYEYNNWKGTRI